VKTENGDMPCYVFQLTAPQAPQDLEEPSELAPHLGQEAPCILKCLLFCRFKTFEKVVL